ncbi:site-specific DNA-methyltransferase [Nibrella viscosa]
MPSLHWIGKEKVINHHHEVPFRVLDHQYTFTAADSPPAGTPAGDQPDQSAADNLIIHGDNLEALKALLPQYEGRVKCIYIDPPYNTGNEGWVYNDNVNDPKIKRWLGQVVGKESEDLSRHDKWLCMMYPRLVLLHRLLHQNGSIWISIDDNEHANLRLILDDIFGGNNFVADILWQKKYTVANDHKTIAPMHDYILVYQKSISWQRNLFPRTEDKDSQYKFQDERGIFRASDYTCNKTAEERPNLFYPIIHPINGDEVWPKRTRVWAYSQDEHKRHLEEDLIYWGKDGKGKVPSYKRYKDQLRNADGVVPHTWWDFQFAGHTDSAKKEIRSIFFDATSYSNFETPKPTSLIERVLQVGTHKDSIVLDSFAGSGTTAHAVLNLNKEDGGNRKFILIEMENYAETITAERVRRVMNGYGDTAGTGGSFAYYKLGERLFDEEGNLNPCVSTDKIRQYLWFTETKGTTLEASSDEPYRLGVYENTAYYFCYQPDAVTTLNYDLLGTIRTRAEQYIIYADACVLPDDYLQQKNIIFKKIPRDITRL